MEQQEQENLIEDAINSIAELGIEALNIAENKLHFKRQQLKAKEGEKILSDESNERPGQII